MPELNIFEAKIKMSDCKLAVDNNNDNIADHFVPDIISANDYFAFGALMPDRNYQANGYRYGFNGKENDNEVKGTGNQQDYGLRIYDPRLGKFLSSDPLSRKFPFYTPYQFAGNKPTIVIDLDGAEEFIVIRWYDPVDPSKYIGSEVIYVVNRGDRKLGSCGTLYLHMTNNAQNKAKVSSLVNASLHGSGNADENNTHFSRTARANKILNGDNLELNSDFVNKPGEDPMGYEGLAGVAAKRIAETSVGPREGIYAKVPISTYSCDIGFDKASSVYKGSLDNDENGKTNDLELNSMTQYLRNSPQCVAIVTGNASLETSLGDADNIELARKRASTVTGRLTRSGISPGRITQRQEYTEGRSRLNEKKDRRARVHININRPQS